MKKEEAISLIKQFGYKAVKVKQPNRNLDLEVVYLLGKESNFVSKDKRYTPRKVQLRVAKSKGLSRVLDKHFKGSKRQQFESEAIKTYSSKSHIQDLGTVGLHKRFRLVERCYGKYFNTSLFKTVTDEDYFPPGYNPKLKKQIIKMGGVRALGKGGARANAKKAVKKKSSRNR